MAITNGYCTLEELRERLISTAKRRQAATVSFASATKKIADSAIGLEMFVTGQRIRVQGSTKNDGYYTIATGGVAAEIVTTQALVDEAAGATVTLTDVTDVDDDLVLEMIVEAASRAIDGQCGRHFYKDSADATRYYSTPFTDALFLPDDIISITTLATDGDGDRVYEDAWAEADYDLLPYNAAADGLPYTWLRVAPDGDYSFPTTNKAIKLIGKFGWPTAAPKQVREACLLFSARLLKRRDAPLGVTGNVELGVAHISKEDSDVLALLEPPIGRGGYG